jgi:hypothetical protein
MKTKNFNDFKKCVKIQGHLDLEVLDITLYEPLLDLYKWWTKQSESTRKFITWLAALGAKPLAAFITRIINLSEKALAVLLAEALIAVFAGVSFGVVMDVVGRCVDQQID